MSIELVGVVITILGSVVAGVMRFSTVETKIESMSTEVTQLRNKVREADTKFTQILIELRELSTKIDERTKKVTE